LAVPGAGATGCVDGMGAAKCAHFTGVSKATATRDLADLFAHGWLAPTGEGRGTRYRIPPAEWRPA
jgi:Fic family protein